MTDSSPAAARRDPTRRFSDRVENYARYRPGYPEEVVATLAREAGLTPSSVVADVGSGTGISSLVFLRLGCRVYGVEPNREMRAEAERRLVTAYPRFTSVEGTAEATTLGAAAADFVVAAQAFHWFDRPRTRAELARVLRRGGWVVLLWNRRLTDDTPFAVAYEELLLEHGTDYRQVDHRQVTPEQLGAFFAGPFESRVFANQQVFDLAGLEGRLLSSSYVPAPGDPRHQPMLDALGRLFAVHQRGGRVRFDYATEMYFGHLAPAAGSSVGG